MTLRHDCARRGCYKDRLPDWAMLAGCFDPEPHVRPLDVDGAVEQNGHCLFLENKGPEGYASAVLLRIFKLLAGQGHAAVIFWTATEGGSDVTAMVVFGLDGYEPVKRPASLDDLRAACADWWKSVY